MKKILVLCLLCVSAIVRGDYSEHAKAQSVIDTLIDKHGFTSEEVKAVLGLANTEQRILDSMANAAEKTKTKMDNQLLPMLSKIVKLLIYFIGFL